MKPASVLYLTILAVAYLLCSPLYSIAAENSVLKIGFNYPETGPYSKQGLDQRRAAELALGEINGAGGILGKKVMLVYRDTKSNPKIARENAEELFDKEVVPMIFGGSSSAVAIAVGKVALQKDRLFFGTLTYSTETTTEDGHRHVFRECYDSYFAANVLSNYLNKNFAGKKFFYVSADYTWGWTTQSVIRKETATEDTVRHPGVFTKLGSKDFRKELKDAELAGTDVLVLSLFGQDMEIAVKQAYEMGLKKKMQIIIPNLTLDMAQGAGPEAMEGIVGATPWYWKIPITNNYAKGIAFVNNFEKKYQRYPSTAGASAYVILNQYKEAVERAKSFETKLVIKALEGHKYIGLKDEQQWRDFDHQSVQTVYAVRIKPAAEILKSKYQQDYYEIIASMKGEEAAITKKEWLELRDMLGMPTTLEEHKHD